MRNAVSYSLHKTRVKRECGVCGSTIPGRDVRREDLAEYWLVKGGSGARIICCLCHVLYGLDDCGWNEAPDGRSIIAHPHPLIIKP